MNTPIPLISIIIVNWNSGKYIEQCFEAVFAQTFKNFEIILVDNGSTDNSLESLILRWPQTQFIQLENNIGFAAANNLASKKAKGKWIALLNSDAFPKNDWLEELHKATLQYTGKFFFASCQIQATDSSKLDGTGDEYNVGGIAWRRQNGESVEKASQTINEVFSACGAAAFYPQEAFLEAGGFDVDFFSYLEDVDLGFRLRLLGYKCLYIPQAKVLHIGSASLGIQSEFAIYHSQRNMLWTFIKNMPFPYVFKYLPYHLVMNLGFVLYYGFCYCFCISLKALKDTLIGLPSILRKRKIVQAQIKVAPEEIMRVIQIPKRRNRNLLILIILFPKFVIQFFRAVKRCRAEKLRLKESVDINTVINRLL